MATATLARSRATKAAALKALTIGQATDEMWALREKKRELEASVKEVETKMKELEGVVFDLMDAQDTRRAEGKSASVSINESTVGNVEDWDAVWTYIAKNKYFHLVQRRLSDPALRELWELGKVVPGVQPFKKRTLSVRSL